MQVVLQWRPSNQKPMLGLQHANCAAELRLLVFDSVRFVDDHVAPSELRQGRRLHVAHLIRCDHHVPVPLRLRHARLEHVAHYILAMFLVAVEANRSQRRTPSGELVHPVTKCRLWHEHQVRAAHFLVFLHEAQNRN